MIPKVFRSLYVQVLAAIAIAVVLGVVAPEHAVAMKPLGDGFIKLVKMLIAPIVFTTVVVGIAQTGAMREVGRIGIATLVYFELTSVLALAIGLLVVSTLRPGAGMAFDPATADASAIAAYVHPSEPLSATGFLLNIIPDTVVGAFARGDVLQVLVFAVLLGLAILRVGTPAARLVDVLVAFSDVLFVVVNLIMRLAPFGAFGAMAYTVGRFGLRTLLPLGHLMLAVYLACALFIVVLSGLVRFVGISPLKFLRYIREEVVIVLGTSSSESVLPRLMAKMEYLGCARPVVGLVVPAGYSFNLDGTAVYMSMAAIFIAQASGVHLGWGQELGILALLMVTSKGAAAVTGSGFVTLAATLSAIPVIPVVGLTLLLGIDRFMSEARAITNFIGNAIATLLMAWWDAALDVDRARLILDGIAPDEAIDMTTVVLEVE